MPSNTTAPVAAAGTRPGQARTLRPAAWPRPARCDGTPSADRADGGLREELLARVRAATVGAWGCQEAELAAEQAALAAAPDGPEPPSFEEMDEACADPWAGPPDGAGTWLADLPGPLLDEYLDATGEPARLGGPDPIKAGFWDRTTGDGAGFASGGVADHLPPGPVLAGLVSDIWAAGLARLTDDELIGVLRAARSLTSWAAALELTAVGDLSHRREVEAEATGDSRAAEHVPHEVAAALTLTARAADSLVGLAEGLTGLPATMAALRAGEIDRQKAAVIAGETAALALAHRAAVERQVLPDSAGQTTAQLRASTRRAVITADPGAAQERQEKAQRDRDRVRKLGWAAGLLAAALEGFAVFGGHHWPGWLGLAAAGAVVAFAPAAPRRLLPRVLLVFGLYGFVLAARYAAGDVASVQYGLVLAGAGSWRTHLVLMQAYVFGAGGLWLLWRTVNRQSRFARFLLSARGAAPGAGGVRWGLLLAPVAVLAAEMFWPSSVVWSIPLAMAAVFIALALAILPLALAVLSQAVAADLAAGGLIGLGVYGIGLALLWPALIATPSAFAPNVLYGAVLVSSRPTAWLAGAQGLLLLGFGAWLVPRTIAPHVRAVLGMEPDAALASRVQRLTETRTVAVDSAAAELRRIERDLHDGAQARLVALGMSLRAVERLIQPSPEAALALVAEARETSSRALADLRDLVRGIYPPVLADRGLADAVRALTLDAPVRTELDIELAGRLEAPVEAACYFAVAEALANAVKHAGASCVQVRVRHTGAGSRSGLLRIEVTDDGVGGADPAKGSGLAGVEERLATFDGILAISSPPGGPTMIVMDVPCALSSPKISSC